MTDPAPSPAEGEAGYALVGAVMALLAVSAVALGIITETRIALAGGGADIARAKAEAGADAGVALALHELVDGGDGAAALVDGRSRTFTLAGTEISVTVEDERGKVPLNLLEDDGVERLLRQAGVDGEALATARDSLLDWLDDDDEPRAAGAEADFYERSGIAPRNGPLRSIDELARVRGFTAAMVERMRPWVTVDPDAAPFYPARATPEALAVMAPGDPASAIAAAREAAGQRIALGFGQEGSLVGHPFTIVADARAPGNGHVRREVRVVIQKSDAHPYAIRAVR